MGLTMPMTWKNGYQGSGPMQSVTLLVVRMAFLMAGYAMWCL